MRLRRLLLSGLLAGIAIPTSHAWAGEKTSESSTYKGWLAHTGKKIVGLAHAIDESKYGWSPGKNVRGVRGVLAHTTGTLYAISKIIGAPAPKGVDVTKLDEIKTKKASVEALERALTHAGKAIDGLDSAALNRPVNLFGRDATMRDAVILAIVHTSEHLGQLIAYARANGVAPPWSRGG